MIVLAAIGWTLLGALALLLAVPFRVAAVAAVHEATPTADLRLEWGWGLLGLQLSPGGGGAVRLLGLRVWRFARAPETEEEAAKKKEEKQAKKRAQAAKEKTQQKKSKGGLASLRTGLQHSRALRSMVARLVRALRLRLRVTGIVGTGDPADTALLFGAVRALKELPGVELELESEWLEVELEVDAQGAARIWIIHLLAVAVGLLWARENRRALWALRSGS